MSWSLRDPVGLALTRTLPLKSRESCETPLIRERISRRGRRVRSMSSTVMVPLVISIMRKMLMIMEVLPLF